MVYIVQQFKLANPCPHDLPTRLRPSIGSKNGCNRAIIMQKKQNLVKKHDLCLASSEVCEVCIQASPQLGLANTVRAMKRDCKRRTKAAAAAAATTVIKLRTRKGPLSTLLFVSAADAAAASRLFRLCLYRL